ncbi:flavodoxin domain-containing protein [Streptomyces sp. NPDC003077]|uniref:flavodoxin domain-containing protein n=1 Tax=Streptomyces sp. NPDC003077 TaxID=3154443 RepID=UPI0033A38AEB
MRVLVGYTGEHGSTRGVAEHVAATLGKDGHEAEVVPLAVPGAGGPAPDHDAFVLGSAVHNGRWMPEADAFLRRYRGELAGRPLWLFSVGLARVLGGWVERRAPDPEPVRSLCAALHPVDHHLFAGAFEREHTGLVGHVVFRAMGGRYGDHRDWDEIGAWADGIARHLATISRSAGSRVPGS